MSATEPGASTETAGAEPLVKEASRIVLVGFMGAGKSTVGPLLAETLGWDYVDMDEEIERRAGTTVPALLDEDPEAFRRLESQVGSDLLTRAGVVLAAGGGWAAQPGHMGSLGPDTLSVWLQVRPATALARIAASPARRPLLEVEDPVGVAEVLLEDRVPHYGQSDIRIDTEAYGPGEIVDRVLEHLRTPGESSVGNEREGLE